MTARKFWKQRLIRLQAMVMLGGAIGAGDKGADGPAVRIARGFGGLSFPLYITRFPLI
ncbi:hypothetical protein QLH51_10390 [Sphingomonas sp. 2R-10]|uniref:hypothetical protein n=1 Tax=Sphingomonas sp. 2R-10 TaxID=3045148 RepID=UPI0019D286E3|nr:hypothetical protein [Sphingomonas sp. 2R-10]MDJ0277202.1 hypothetical protein [Sphingomonas sp. 2R-10]